MIREQIPCEGLMRIGIWEEEVEQNNGYTETMSTVEGNKCMSIWNLTHMTKEY
jgi:hypothetical protein